MPAKAKKTAMTAAHKQALAEGREQSRVVRDYLDALEAHKPKRGRKRTAESVKKNLAEVNQSLKAASGSRQATRRSPCGAARRRDRRSRPASPARSRARPTRARCARTSRPRPLR